MSKCYQNIPIGPKIHSQNLKMAYLILNLNEDKLYFSWNGKFQTPILHGT